MLQSRNSLMQGLALEKKNNAALTGTGIELNPGRSRARHSLFAKAVT
jgi:hypothetical protein